MKENRLYYHHLDNKDGFLIHFTNYLQVFS